jgi:hypothetical protein
LGIKVLLSGWFGHYGAGGLGIAVLLLRWFGEPGPHAHCPTAHGGAGNNGIRRIEHRQFDK